MDFERNKDYILKNRNGSEEICQVIYYPLLTDYKGNPFNPPRAVIQIKKKNGFDFREVPGVYIESVD